MRQVLQYYNDQELSDQCRELFDDDLDPTPHGNFHSIVRKIIRRIDYAKCKTKIQDSAQRGSQATRIYKAVVRKKAAELPYQLKVQVPRFCIPNYIQMLCGCDLLTPYSALKRPDCKFCGASKISWPHLLFNCPNLKFNRHKIISDLHNSLNPAGKGYSDFLSRKSKDSRKLISKLWNKKQYDRLFELCMGILHDFDLGYKHLIHEILEVTIPIFHRIANEWDTM